MCCCHASGHHRQTIAKSHIEGIVVAERVECILFWRGFTPLILALFRVIAHARALYGALAFTLTWGGFLAVGNHFCDWFGHVRAPNTHNQITLMGTGRMVLVAMG
ncbi:MAG: DUF2165 family protein [Roseobacter sp.]